MPQFAYKARRRSGEVVQGVFDVADRAAAAAQIERLGLFPVSIDAPRGAGAAAAAPVASLGASRKAAAVPQPAAMPKPVREMFARKRKPKLEELATFTTQLANLLKAGMPLTAALQSMTYLQTKGIPGDVSRQLRQDVTEGKGLSEAMAKQREIFSDMYVNMVRAGEQSGSLVEVLRRLAEHYERFAEVQHKVVSALVYPAFVMGVGVVIVFFFMTFMLPKFLSIFSSMKAVSLPMSTQMLIGISNFFSSVRNQVVLGFLVVAGVILFSRFKATAEGRRKIDGWAMQAPVVGRVVRLNLFGQFARTLGTLLQNGVPVLTALKITEQVVPNVVLKDAVAATREAVTDGKTLAQPLARAGVFPQLMIDLIKIGEETGDVPGALKNVAETYENELSVALRVMMNMIEPIMIIFIAVGVGFLLFSVLSAMFSITSNLGR